MIRILMLSALLGCAYSAFTQADSLNEKLLEEVVISSNKFAERKRNINQKIDVISAKTIAAINAQNAGDLLSSTGNVFVQKSQQGGSSPVLRGFEASRVLLVIDGIRMNNAIYRAGHLQNVITVDQNMLERVEVLYGPASTLYGSDALGGVIHLITKKPKLSFDKKIVSTGIAFSRYSSANNEKTIHADLSLGGKKISWLQSYTYSYFGDMKMGSNYPAKYPDFGRRDSLISTMNGIDTVIANKDTRLQKFSSYKQWDITQKILFKQSEKVSHLLNFQFSNSTNVPRYDRLQDKRNFSGSIGTTLRFAEWYYGPQTRILGSYELNASTAGLFDMVRVNLNYQKIEESRHQREYRSYDKFDSRYEELSIVGFVIDARKKWGVHELTTGVDGQLNFLSSAAARTNKNTGAITPLDPRYPDGKNNMNYFGLFAQHLMKLNNEKLILNDGFRLQAVSLSSSINDNSFFNLPVTQFEQNTFAITGNLGAVYLPKEDFRISAGFSSGFRNPNIDDLARVFESSTDLKRVVIPNAAIKPEFTYNVDLGISKTFAQKIKMEVTGFYSLFRNAIGLAPFKLNGQDSILYNGIRSAVFANRNVNKASTYGFNANLKADIKKCLSFFGTITYTHGSFKNSNGTKTPQDHIPPLFGKLNLIFTHQNFSSEGFVMFNGWKRIKNYNLEGEDNLQYATPDGMPSWATLNWRNSYNLNPNFQIQFAIENIFDRNYRYFASGFSSPGRNFILAARASF